MINWKEEGQFKRSVEAMSRTLPLFGIAIESSRSSFFRFLIPRKGLPSKTRVNSAIHALLLYAHIMPTDSWSGRI
jgi:hypothetical protein